MGKYKKTRKEKIITDLRHKLNAVKNQNLYAIVTPTEQITIQKKSTIEPVDQNVNSPVTTTLINSYPYLKHDVLKILILTLAIVTFQIALLFILKRHLIILPGLRF